MVSVSAEVHRKWTYSFLAKFSSEMYSIYVHGPRDSDELNGVTSLYAACGFPGCGRFYRLCSHSLGSLSIHMGVRFQER